MKTTKDTGYKARSTRGQCNKCENDGAYGMEVSAYGLEQNGMSGDTNYHDFSGNYCPDHITEDMMDMIRNGDSGQSLKDMLTRITKTFLEELKEDYGGEPKKVD